MTQYIKKLPAVFQTVTEKKFFDATFDQVFSKKDSEYLNGYLGRRDPGSYNPITDFYLPEPSKNRTWWQLEATAFAREPDSTKTNVFFYEDLLDKIEYYGGNTLNQDRLFESQYYSFGPPIDYDMFSNYQNYYWIEEGLPVIEISGVMGADIIGQSTYTTPGSATPPNLTLTTGMSIVLLDDPAYTETHYVENFGGCQGIGLVPKSRNLTPGTVFEFLPWDSQSETTSGRLIQNLYWDALTWEVQAAPAAGDYVTIERGSQDQNAWSRTNRWFHISAINASLAATNSLFPTNASRALRPIIQFSANMELFNAGTQFRNEISFGFGYDAFDNPIARSDLQGQQLVDINNDYNIELQDGQLVTFFFDPTLGVSNFIWLTNVSGAGVVTFTQYTSGATPVLEGDVVIVLEDGPFSSAQSGQSWFYSNSVWQEVYNEKIAANQAPLFQLYDHNNIKLSDQTVYPDNTFLGSKVFSYKINSAPGATVDPILNFPIVYTSLGQATDIVFQNNLITDRYTYTLERAPIDGYYYYKFLNGPVLFNSWNLYDICDCDDIVPPPPCNCIEVSKQRVIDKFVVGYGSEFKFKLSVTPYGYPDCPDIVVSVNDTEVKGIAEQANGYVFETINNNLYIDLSAYLTGLLLAPQSVAPVVEAQTYTHDNLDPASNGYFEIPQQLEANPGQAEVSELSGSDLTQHFTSIISNQIGFEGSAFGGVNNYRDLRKNRSLGQYILQNVAPTLKSMLVSSEDDIDFIVSERFSQNEFTKFKNKYLTVALQLINQEFNPVQYHNNSIVIGAWVNQILKTINISKEFSDSFAYSYMAASGTPTYTESVTALGNSIVSLTEYVDLTDPKNVMYIYDVTDPAQQRLLIVGVDYDIISTTPTIDVQLDIGVASKDLEFYLYQNPLPTYIPSTPTKLGMYGAYIPRIELDTTYVDPTEVIIGHDGSKTVAYGDYRDQLLLELEIRIYNGIQSKFRDEYALPVRIESVREGYFRSTRYTREEYLEITNSYLNKWSSKNRANYRVNEWPQDSLSPAVVPSFVPGVGNIWKLYNYTAALKVVPNPLAIPGYEAIIAANGQTVFNTTLSTVAIGAGQVYLLVFRNGVMQMEGVGLNYTVTGANQITLSTPTVAGDNIVIHSFGGVIVPVYEAQTALAAQTIINAVVLPDLVFINGVEQVAGVSYTVTGPTQITLNVPMALADNIALVTFAATTPPNSQSSVAAASQTVVNTPFSTTAGPGAGFVFRNGVYQLLGVSGNYTVTGTNQITFNAPLSLGDDIDIYFYEPDLSPAGAPLNLPGNWKGIFQYYYDTFQPDTRPWEMLGFSEEPSWWRFEYGAPLVNIAGQEVWGATAAGNNVLYSDLEQGIIRQGPTALFDPITLGVQPQPMWARPGLSMFLPVDASGEVRSVMEIFDIIFSGNYYAPFDHFDDDWVYGDGSPVEQAWMSTSGYRYSVQEFLFLTRPGPFGELMWDTLGTEISPSQLSFPGLSTYNWQYVQNDLYSFDDEFFAWFRPKNSDQYVHAEVVDSETLVRFGYQTWISDRILFLGKDVGDTFGQKIRTLDVNLANKLAGFTNKDTTNTYIESVTPGATNDSLIIPSTNFDVILHKSPVVDTYAYSGIIIRALENGTFVVYGYDLLNAEFTILDRSSDKLIDITIGGTPEGFVQFESGATYNPGDIVRYNGVYYRSLVTQVAQKFIQSGYIKLRALPIVGGVSVSYKPVSKTTITKVPYGSVLRNVQEVFDLMIGWGAYLETQGWQFQDVSNDTNQISDWLSSAKQFLFWINTNWAPDASIQLSPLSNSASLIVSRGYPNDVEELTNGVYSILDKNGIAIAPESTSTDREGRLITVAPVNLAAGGIYYLQVNASETEHVLIFDNVTNFDDTVYSPLLRARQQRLRYNGFRSNGWYGKMEAPGYLIIENQLVPNYDSIVDAMRYYYDPNVTLDNPSLEALGQHLTGYESKSYLDNLQVSNDVQYLFYQGAIRQKGTTQAFEKLFRSTKVQSDDIIEVYEEWALKLSSFGNTIEQVSTEFKMQPEQNTGEVIVAKLNYVPSDIGFVSSIYVVNAENIYSNLPKVIITAPDANPADLPPGKSLVQATAYIVLNPNGTISRVDIVNPGYGYLAAPSILIDSGSEPNNLDRLQSVWQGEIISDTTIDNIINIDIDETEVWTVRPPDPVFSLEFPTTPQIDYAIPNAGYVNFNDVDLHSFDVEQTVTNWGSENFNPVANDSLWVAKTFTEDWNVYKLVDVSVASGFDVIEGTTGLQLRTLQPYLITTQFSTSGETTDFGNLVVLQVIEATATATLSAGVVTEITIDKAGANYDIAPQVTIAGDGIGAIAFATVVGGEVTSVEIVSGGSGYTFATVTIAAPTSVSGDNNFAMPINFNEADTTNFNNGYNYYDLLTLEGDPVSATDVPGFENFTDLFLFKTLRFLTTPATPSYVSSGDRIWVDQAPVKWTVFLYTGATPIIYREQEELINTSLFRSATVFDDNGVEQALLPIYDPFKNILPGLAKQNLTYLRLQDPARYNVTPDERLFSENITFGPAQVGQLWWDLSNTKFVYYEQPLAVGETELDNLIYRRDYWASLFPGSTVDVYEWVESDVPPSQYTGTGAPRSTTAYVQITTSNRFTSATEIKYYFWVLGATDKPNIENRTLAAAEVTRLLQSPKVQGFVFFAPIQQTGTNNSYMFYNVQEILAFKGNNVQMQYRIGEREDQEHTQWSFFRENDPNSVVTDQFWNKMVDSITGYTKILPPSSEYSDYIIIARDLPWDIFGWDVAPFDDANSVDSAVYGIVLPVPDPELSEAEKYGVTYRPRQGMFVNLLSARKVFVQSANELLSHIPIRDSNAGWNASVSTNRYWTYTNWYKIGYEGAVPTIIFSTLVDANTALTAGQLSKGTILQVTNGTVDGRFNLYTVVQLDPNLPTLSLDLICIQNSAIKLLNTVYTAVNKYGLSEELRELLNAFRTEIFINQYIVDQNQLFFSMLNYVMSEQKNPNWLFKSSYIYIKENNLPLSQSTTYIPNQIENIISYITDSKPYHTKIRDYTASYSTTDIAPASANDAVEANISTYTPWDAETVVAGPDSWDSNSILPWDEITLVENVVIKTF